MRKNILIASLFILTGFIATAQKIWVEDPNISLRPIQGSFSEIKISGGIQLYLSQSDEARVAVSASDEDLVSGIKTVVDGKTLKIYYEGNKKNWYKKNANIKAYVSFNRLEKIAGSGATSIKVDGAIRVPSLLIDLSGASSFTGNVQAGSLMFDLSGASDVKIFGKVEQLTVETSGASDIKGFGLESETCHVKASGASDIQVTVLKELKANASGASSIYYKGSAVITDIHSSGASSIKRKD